MIIKVIVLLLEVTAWVIFTVFFSKTMKIMNDTTIGVSQLLKNAHFLVISATCLQVFTILWEFSVTWYLWWLLSLSKDQCE